MAISIERTDFVAVQTQDPERSRTFYTEVLGLPQDPNARFEVMAGDTRLGIWAPEQNGMPFAPSESHIVFGVPDVAAARAELEAAGVAFEGDTFDTGVCHMAIFRDPDGNALMLHRRYAPTKPA